MMRKFIWLILCGVGLSSCLNHQYLKKYSGLNQSKSIVTDDAIITFHTTKKDVKTWKRREYTWFKTGKIYQTIGYYDGELLHGAYQEEHPERKGIATTGVYAKGKKKGSWTTYNGGKVAGVEFYRFGQMYKSREFFTEGRRITHYKRDKPVKSKEWIGDSLVVVQSNRSIFRLLRK